MKYLLLCALSFFNFARAIEPSVDLLKESLVLLRANGSCGTGFVLSSGKIITNSHVIDDKCNQLHCPDVEISQAKAIGSAPIPILHTKLEIVATFPYSDMAILKPLKPLGISGLSGKIAAPIDKENFLTIGFPSCESLQITTGTVTQVTDHEFGLGTPIYKGQSGSPIFNKNLDIIGLAYKSNDDNLGLGSRIDHLGMDLEGIAAKNGLVDLKRMYASYFRVVTTSESYFEISSFERKLHVQDIEAQVALSGLCPQLKDYWIWIHANFPMNIPPPYIDTKSLSQECYELFQESVEHHSYKTMVDDKAFFLNSYRDKIETLKTLSPMAYFAEEQFFQISKIYQNENLLFMSLLEAYAFPFKIVLTSMTCLFILFFLFYFLANRFYLFKKILIGSFLFCFFSAVLFWSILRS